MIEFIVNETYKEGNATHSMVLEDELVIFNLKLVYGMQKTEILINSIKEKNENCYFISRFGNFIGFFRFQTDNGFSLKLTDFKNNFDTALDEYLELQKKDWKNEDIIKYLQIAKEIEKSNQPSKTIILNKLK